MKNNPLNGVRAVRVDGSPLRLKGHVTWSVGGIVKKSVSGPSKHAGYAGQYEPAYVEGTLTDGSDLKLADLQAMEKVTVEVDLLNGKTIVYPEAYYVNLATSNSEEGEVPFRFESEEAKEF